MIYLDYAATTPCSSKAIEAMNTYHLFLYGNPSSEHSMGIWVSQQIEESRKYISYFFDNIPSHIYFCSGATEANNIVIKGTCLKLIGENALPSIAVLATEHHSCLSSVEWCKAYLKANIYTIPVNEEGEYDREYLHSLLKNTHISLLIASELNNETGVSFDRKEICDLCHEYNTLVLGDLTQALPNRNCEDYPLKSSCYDCYDFATFSGHKIYGPKGIGGIYIKDSNSLVPLITGGNQERYLRGGTLNAPGIIGMGEAFKELTQYNNSYYFREKHLLKTKFYNEFSIFGNQAANYYNSIININCGCDSSAVAQLLNEEDICVSTGAACTDNTTDGSHVLKAMGQNPHHGLRVSLGRYTTDSEVKYAIEEIHKAISKVKDMELENP